MKITVKGFEVEAVMAGFRETDKEFVRAEVQKRVEDGWNVTGMTCNTFAEIIVHLDRPPTEGSPAEGTNKVGEPRVFNLLRFFPED